uniref:B30.2/SPRY domain-containing protein n=1 Tax=Meloidogyne hapla TaxID=6305 RepID=A0A1I8BB86_MELHA
MRNNAYTSDVGTVNIKDQMIEYIPSEKGKNSNNMVRVYGQFKFSKASAEPTCNSLYYFEVKFNMVKKHQPQKSEMATIGVDSVPAIVTFVSSMMPENYTKCIYICCSKYGKIRYAGKAWSDGDICGCGVVFPPVGISGKQPYVFFTKNGKLFEKAIALEDPIDLFRPFIGVHSCTVETNFGENLDKKPFMYDVTKHVTPKTFFKETEFASAN